MIEMMRIKHIPAVLTIDGPRGPAKKCKRGIVEIAKQTGAMIQPIHAEASSYWIFNSWDKFRLPKPFSTIYVLYVEPIAVDSQITLDQVPFFQEKVEQNLLQLEIKFNALKEKNYAIHS